MQVEHADPEINSPPRVLGIEIGGTKLQIVSGSTGQIRTRWRAAVDRAAGGAGICRQLQSGLADLLAAHPAEAVGVGFGGPVDWRAGRVRCSHQIAGWEDFPLSAWLAKETGLPVLLENDANIACLGESVYGAATGRSPAFYFNLGSGVGGGLAINQKIYHGVPPGEAEFGHLRLDRSGATVEQRCSGWSIDQRIRQMARQSGGWLAKALPPTTHGAEAALLSEAIAHDDSVAVTILSELADDLAYALSHVVHLLHPAVIVVGGGLSLIGEPLRAAIADALPKYIMAAFAPGPPVMLAALGEDAVPIGAMELAEQLRKASHKT